MARKATGTKRKRAPPKSRVTVETPSTFQDVQEDEEQEEEKGDVPDGSLSDDERSSTPVVHVPGSATGGEPDDFVPEANPLCVNGRQPWKI